ncbi:MAG: hypothetical protein JWO80_605, partial [Bryobacterales bacterium]|nr:hypothetical protein [Bryobacterales bacterium]
ATTSFPEPVSPEIRTVHLRGATSRIRCEISSMGLLPPTRVWLQGKLCAGVIIAAADQTIGQLRRNFRIFFELMFFSTSPIEQVCRLLIQIFSFRRFRNPRVQYL